MIVDTVRKIPSCLDGFHPSSSIELIKVEIHLSSERGGEIKDLRELYKNNITKLRKMKFWMK